MQTSELLHYAFRADDPDRLAFWYADLFDGQVLLHPVMTALGIQLIKLNHPDALFHGLLEFWPWDVVWDGAAAVFRRVEAKRSPTSYGHLALKVPRTADEIVAELNRRGIAHRMEPRGPGFLIPTIDDPEGNMIELFPNVDHMDLPPGAFCPPDDRGRAAIAALRQRFAERTANHPAAEGYPLFLEDR
jgi:hypothetical protein